MAEPTFLKTPQGRNIACHRTEGTGPGVVFLIGYRSDMDGTKCLFLEDWARRTGRAFLRFDYSGHGQSDLSIDQTDPQMWAEDALAVLDAMTEGPQVLVGSSLGGWMSMVVAARRLERVAGLVTIAAAPDFTEGIYHHRMSDAQRAEFEATGRTMMSETDFGSPDYFTHAQFEGGKAVSVLSQPFSIEGPVRLLQGTQDEAVGRDTLLQLVDHIDCPDLRMSLVKGADHRFSDPDCLALILRETEDVLSRVGG